MNFKLATPTYFDEEAGIALFQGDCIEILPEIVADLAGQVDLILTDFYLSLKK